MNDEQNQRDRAKQERLRAALRENLKRRKSQARGRSEAPDEAGKDSERRENHPRATPSKD
jgi:hypothetical protein